ncbi:flagellar assembly protein FliW [Salipaludibacillus sp. CUR1]|uniref:flagellar assembly protein FliW n=1 Tax=Salipaludibacillus sp. CUR1 TaxID=2820003 RepID=UPI001E3D0639|nr:flagellar assembly protein FliW [Salipaludibacillus sp. CUR1]MCE7792724.1 flagellar assembly protein FliW [Salipaludibacillus sp. CUR1]
MIIETKYSGPTEINPDNIIQFDQGLPSFEDEKAFVLLPFSDEPGPFYILQSTVTPGLAFAVMTPFSFFPDYEVKLSDQLLETLDITNEQDVALFTVLTLKETIEESTANLRGPIVINTARKKGKQIVLNDSGYETKHSLKQPAASGKKEG